MHLYRVSAALVKPTAQLRNNPLKMQFATYLLSAICIAISIAISKLLEIRGLVIGGLLLSLLVLVGLPVLMFRKGKLLQISTLGFHLGASGQLFIPIKDVVSVVFALGPKPERPRRARARLAFGRASLATSSGLVVSEEATYHTATVLMKGGAPVEYYFALNTPKEFGALQSIIQQWQTAGLNVTATTREQA
jgi:hypothetical protein